MNFSVVDTDTLSEILKQKNPRVVARAEAYLARSFAEKTR